MSHILTEKCPYCGKWFAGADMVRFGGFMKRCDACHNQHIIQLIRLGQNPTECGECHATFEQLSERAEGAQVPMYVHMKDGVYQLLCRACSDEYEAKRRELYVDTPYGKAKGIL